MKRRPPPDNMRLVQPIDGNVRYSITNKTGRIVQCESHLERRLALMLERDKKIRDFCSQPDTFYFVDDQGNRHRYTFDFRSWMTSGEIQNHEVTLPERKAENPNLLLREKFGRELSIARHETYIIHTPETLLDDTETANHLFFYGFRAKSYRNPHIYSSVLTVLERENRLPLVALIDSIYADLSLAGVQKPMIYNTIYHLIWHDEIQIDWKKLFVGHAGPLPRIQVWRNL